MKSLYPYMMLFFALLLLSNCAAGMVSGGAAVGLVAIQEKTLGEALDDANASNQLKLRLLADKKRRFEEVDVEISNSLALLSGRVNAPEDRLLAEKMAWEINIIEEVANEIQIEPPGGFTHNMRDSILTTRVRARLLSSSKVRSINFNIETYDRVVYLMGFAHSQDELRNAAQIASRVGGVRKVVSYVEIRPKRDAALDK